MALRRSSRRSSPSRVRRERGKGSLLQEQLRSEVIVNIRETMYELDCGCGCHLEGKDAQCLIIKFFLHLEAAHPEIEEPTIELTEEMVTVNLRTQVFPPQRAESRSHERAYPSIRAT
jgi:hypothetical protein